jgi:hypothetical protein
MNFSTAYLKQAIEDNNRWYKNCKSVRKRGGKICEFCPFRLLIEDYEQAYRR